MRLRRSRVAALVWLVTGAAPLPAQVSPNPEGGGATFLLLPVGARAAALGRAAIADGGSSEAAFWNPAGLATLPASEATLHYASTFVSNNTALSAHFAGGRLGVIGASAYLVDYGSQPVMTAPGTQTGRIRLSNVELLASYATEVAPGLGLGVNYKLVQFRQDCSGDCGTARAVVGTTHGVDAGLQYAVGANDDLRIGIAVRHAGFKLQLENRDQADPLPTRVQVGIAYRVSLPRPEGIEEALDARILIDLQDEWGEYDSPNTLVGIELGVAEIVRLRSGYAFVDSESSGPSIGVGLRFGRFALDFARIFYDASSFDEPVHLSLRVSL